MLNEKIKDSTFFMDKEKKRLAKRNLESIEQIKYERYCAEERKTKQILGYGFKAIKNDIIYYSIDLSHDEKFSNFKILKYFKY